MTLPRKELFHLPEGVIYLDGNSLGPLPRSVPARLSGAVTDEWGEMLIRGWNDAGWADQPARVGNRIAGLIGAPEGSVTMGDTLSIKVYQALAAALAMRPDRRVVISDSGNFPTDLYMAEGLLRTLGRGHELRVVAPEDVDGAIGEDVAAVMLTEVDYRTGPASRHVRDHRQGTRCRRGDDLGPCAQRGRGAGGHDRLERGIRGRLHLQVSQRRPRRARPSSTSGPISRTVPSPHCRAGSATRRPLPSTSTTARPAGSSGCASARPR